MALLLIHEQNTNLVEFHIKPEMRLIVNVNARGVELLGIFSPETSQPSIFRNTLLHNLNLNFLGMPKSGWFIVYSPVRRKDGLQ